MGNHRDFSCSFWASCVARARRGNGIIFGFSRIIRGEILKDQREGLRVRAQLVNHRRRS